MKSTPLIPLAVFLAAAATIQGSIITDYPVLVSYDSGVSPTAGTTGAADPGTQGWTDSGATGNNFAYGADSTIGGWRITDGTNAVPFFYQQSISGTDAAQMTGNGWLASWTTAVNADAVSAAGGGVDNYYSSVPTRQTNNAFWLELAGNGLFILSHETDANGDIFLNDGANLFQVTGSGNNLSEELGAGAPSATYITYTLAFSTLTGTATLSDSLGGTHGAVATSGVGSTNRVVWGATSSFGQGSTTWNALSIAAVPEASEVSLFALGALALAFYRRK